MEVVDVVDGSFDASDFEWESPDYLSRMSIMSWESGSSGESGVSSMCSMSSGVEGGTEEEEQEEEPTGQNEPGARDDGFGAPTTLGLDDVELNDLGAARAHYARHNLGASYDSYDDDLVYANNVGGGAGAGANSNESNESNENVNNNANNNLEKGGQNDEEAYSLVSDEGDDAGGAGAAGAAAGAVGAVGAVGAAGALVASGSKRALKTSSSRARKVDMSGWGMADSSEYSGTLSDEYIFFEGEGAGVANWSRYRVGSRTIRISQWRCCGRHIETLETDNILDVQLVQNCLHRRRGRGIIEIGSHDPTTPLLRLKVDNAVPIFLRLRAYCATNCDPDILDIIKSDRNVEHFENDSAAIAKGSYKACCWGRGCPCTRIACCSCCEPVDHFSVNNSFIRLHRKACCYSKRSSVFLDWTYDLKLARRCRCCCTRWCEYSVMQIFSFDQANPTLNIRIKGDGKDIMEEVSKRISLVESTRQHWLRQRTQTVVDEAFKTMVKGKH